MDDFIIAIVDDDALVREGLQRLVSSLNFRAEPFSSTEALLAFGELQDVRCIVCDINTPGGSNELALQRLTKMGYRIPFVFMTALPSESQRERLMDAGAVCVLTKPFHQSEMEMCIASALNQPTGPHRRRTRQPKGRDGQQSRR